MKKVQKTCTRLPQLKEEIIWFLKKTMTVMRKTMTVMRKMMTVMRKTMTVMKKLMKEFDGNQGDKKEPLLFQFSDNINLN